MDRIISLYLGHPLARLLTNGDLRIPILMYHSISADPEDGVHPYYRVNTAPGIFEAQMRLLRDAGFKSLTVSQLVALLDKGGSVRERLVAITFDDGYRDLYLEAFPILQRYGLTATVYLPTAFIGDSPLRFKGRECLTWSEVSEMAKEGIEFGSHTVHHPRLVELHRSDVVNEIRDSKDAIEQRLGEEVSSFAVPYAFPEHDPTFASFLRDTLAEAGYTSNVTTILGTAVAGDNPFFLKRLPVNSSDDEALFRAKLAGAYNWLRLPQLLSKRAAAWL